MLWEIPFLSPKGKGPVAFPIQVLCASCPSICGEPTSMNRCCLWIAGSGDTYANVTCLMLSPTSDKTADIDSSCLKTLKTTIHQTWIIRIWSRNKFKGLKPLLTIIIHPSLHSSDPSRRSVTVVILPSLGSGSKTGGPKCWERCFGRSYYNCRNQNGKMDMKRSSIVSSFSFRL